MWVQTITFFTFPRNRVKFDFGGLSSAHCQSSSNEKVFSANVPLSPFVTAWYTEDISRVWKGGREFCQLSKPQNQGEDAQGKIEQQQALSFWNCPQHEWEPQMMSKEKGTSNAQKGSNRRPGYQEIRGTLLVECSLVRQKIF